MFIAVVINSFVSLMMDWLANQRPTVAPHHATRLAKVASKLNPPIVPCNPKSWFSNCLPRAANTLLETKTKQQPEESRSERRKVFLLPLSPSAAYLLWVKSLTFCDERLFNLVCICAATVNHYKNFPGPLEMTQHRSANCSHTHYLSLTRTLRSLTGLQSLWGLTFHNVASSITRSVLM